MSDETMGTPTAPDQGAQNQDGRPAVDPDALMVIGEIIMMASRSGRHRDYTVADVERNFLQAAAMDQMRIYRSEVEPVGIVTWALLSDELDQAMEKDDVELKPEDWRSGDNLWIIEMINHPDVGPSIQADLTQTVFPNKVGKMRVLNPETKEWSVETYYGANRQGDAKQAKS